MAQRPPAWWAGRGLERVLGALGTRVELYAEGDTVRCVFLDGHPGEPREIRQPGVRRGRRANPEKRGDQGGGSAAGTEVVTMQTVTVTKLAHTDGARLRGRLGSGSHHRVTQQTWGPVPVCSAAVGTSSVQPSVRHEGHVEDSALCPPTPSWPAMLSRPLQPAPVSQGLRWLCLETQGVSRDCCLRLSSVGSFLTAGTNS